MRAIGKPRPVLKRIGIATMLLLLAILIGSAWLNISWSVGPYWGFVQSGGIAVGPRQHKMAAIRVARNEVFGLDFWWLTNELSTPGLNLFIVPIWMVIAAVGIPTGILWVREVEAANRGSERPRTG